MKKQTKTKFEILFDKVKKKFTKNEDFAYNHKNGECYYYMKDGRRCSIGILLPIEEAKKLEKFSRSCIDWGLDIKCLVDEIKDRNKWKMFPNLHKLYKKYSIIELIEIQNWHDNKADLL